MIKLILTEWLKLKHSRYFWIYILVTPCMCCLSTYILASGFNFKSGIASQSAAWEIWKAISSMFFTVNQVILTLMAGIFMIGWQKQEHADNTFKLYQLLPVDVFSALQVRYYLFFFIYAFTSLLSLLIGIKLIEWIWTTRFLEYSYDLKLTPELWRYLIEYIKASILLSFPVFLFLFIVSIKTNKATVSFLTIIGLCIASFLSLPDWIFFKSVRAAFRIIRVLNGHNFLYTEGDLWRIYIYSVISTLGLLAIKYHLIKTNQFFMKES